MLDGACGAVRRVEFGWPERRVEFGVCLELGWRAWRRAACGVRMAGAAHGVLSVLGSWLAGVAPIVGGVSCVSVNVLVWCASGLVCACVVAVGCVV